LFDVVHDGHTILISVVTACSGVDGMVGFLLIGAALTAVVSGSLTRKALWLGVGLALLWCLNLARLLLICWVARVAGPRLALGALHPAAGLVMFCLGVGLMSVLLRPFGLRRRATVAPASSPAGTSASSPVFSTVVILLLATVVLSVSDSGLRVFDPVAGATGEPKLGSFLADPATPAGWTASFVTEYDMNKPLFGEDSRWFRYTLSDTAPQSSSLHSRLPVTADVIDAGGLSGFEAYGVTACYSFHGYVLRDVATVDLGDGIKGQALSYSGGAALSHQDWSIVYWILPVETGAGTRYERVILYVQNTAAASVSLAPGVPGAAQLTATRKAADPEQRLLLTDQTFLVAFARQVIAGQVHQRDTGVLVDAITTPNSTASVWAASRAQDQAGQAPSGGSTASAAGSSSPAAGPDAGFWLAYGQHHVTPAATSGGR
jgi:exosortase/archaeosortase family protein